MLFNSIEFLIFLPIVFVLYWFTFKKLVFQNILILTASYVFYGWWDWRFLSLILLSTLVDFTIGNLLQIQNNQAKRKLLFWCSIVFNIGLLATFKYFNFFVDNWISAWESLGVTFDRVTLEIVLPVGISFYTFQTLSYTIDIYRKKLNPTKDFFAFASFVAFFPQLVAGPIERASNLLPQFFKKRKFNYENAVDGLRQMLWGFFKKVVIADNCAEYVNIIFENYSDYSGATLIAGAILFAFQIYGDFSGYSDIAIGTARLFGFELMQNFAYPYFSRDISEFWRRWHISLSTWFRDYVYIPLGGSRVNNLKKLRNILIIFIVSGFWHGANWTFIIWGALNALFFLPLIFLDRNRVHLDIVAQHSRFPNVKEVLQILTTFLITTFAWIFFRAENLAHATNYISGIFDLSVFKTVEFHFTEIGILLLFFLVIEWIGRREKYAIEHFLVNKTVFIRWSFYMLLILMIFAFGKDSNEFIYFQF